ncbi:MAG: dienelactone hydrolase family protein [Flavobacteriales bacterium]|nr:dienelactone hydrolase family protein [Flavobacteriales bacterium]
MKYILSVLLLVVTCTMQAQSLESITYSSDGQSFTAYYAKPIKITPKTKTILIVHEWWGLNDYPKTRALQIAQEGNIGFCIDMYGTGKIVDNPTDAQILAGPFYQDPQLAYNRFMAGYNEALKIEGVDPSKVAAIGYCFGGSIALNAAKKGAPVDAVVSFHGELVGIPVDKTKLTASVLVCNGAADSFVPEADVVEIKKQMSDNGEDFTFINYADATHAFTNPKSTEVGKKYGIPIGYNAAADAKSWKDFKKFLKKKVK